MLLAKVGALFLTGALVVPAALSSASAQASSVMVATASDVAPDASAPFDPRDATIDPPELMPRPALTAVVAASALVDETATFAAAPSSPEPLVTDGVVLASWYGPGFYGNRTACGQTFTAESVGVAHRTLPCGTQIQVTSPGGVTVVTSVIDRGPYVAGRSLDLSFALKNALRCGDLCSVHMVVVDR